MSDQRMHPAKAAAGALAVILAAWVGKEGFTPEPVIPVQGDVPTIGHGATYYEDGTQVAMDDPPISRARALELATWHLSSIYMRCVVEALGDVPVLPKEIEIATDFAGQYGCGAWRSNASSPLQSYKRLDYTSACSAYLSYKFMTADKRLGSGWEPYKSGGKTRWRFDCSTPGNKVCRGVWTRSQERYNDCMNAQVAP